jgi:hypothetical protein
LLQVADSILSTPLYTTLFHFDILTQGIRVGKP